MLKQIFSTEAAETYEDQLITQLEQVEAKADAVVINIPGISDELREKIRLQLVGEYGGDIHIRLDALHHCKIEKEVDRDGEY